METFDWMKAFKELYAPPRKPVLVTVPSMNFIMIDGQGDPNTAQEYSDALDALYAAAYTLKFAIKKAGGPAKFGLAESLTRTERVAP